jgi:hypothetical protein
MRANRAVPLTGTGADGNLTVDGGALDMSVLAYRVNAPPENMSYINITGTGLGIGAGDRILVINLQGCA